MLLKGCSLHVSIQLPYSWNPVTPRSSCLSMTAWQRSRPTRPLTGPSGLNTISLIISQGSSRAIPLTMFMTKSRPSSKLIPRTPFGYPPMRCFNEKKTFSVWQNKNLKTQHRVISQSANIQIQGKAVRVYPSYPVQIYWWCLNLNYDEVMTHIRQCADRKKQVGSQQNFQNREVAWFVVMSNFPLKKGGRFKIM